MQFSSLLGVVVFVFFAGLSLFYNFSLASQSLLPLQTSTISFVDSLPPCNWLALTIFSQLTVDIELQEIPKVFRATSANVVFVCSYSAFAVIFAVLERSERSTLWVDSIYYLGFILTLAALIVALGTISLATNLTDLENIAETLVQNAIALSSTLAALILRTLAALIMPQSEQSEEIPELVAIDRRLEENQEKIDGILEIYANLSEGLSAAVDDLKNKISEGATSAQTTLSTAFLPLSTAATNQARKLNTELQGVIDLIERAREVEENLEESREAIMASMGDSKNILEQLEASIALIIGKLGESYLNPEWQERVADQNAAFLRSVESLTVEFEKTRKLMEAYIAATPKPTLRQRFLNWFGLGDQK